MKHLPLTTPKSFCIATLSTMAAFVVQPQDALVQACPATGVCGSGGESGNTEAGSGLTVRHGLGAYRRNTIKGDDTEINSTDDPTASEEGSQAGMIMDNRFIGDEIEVFSYGGDIADNWFEGAGNYAETTLSGDILNNFFLGALNKFYAESRVEGNRTVGSDNVFDGGDIYYNFTVGDGNDFYSDSYMLISENLTFGIFNSLNADFTVDYNTIIGSSNDIYSHNGSIYLNSIFGNFNEIDVDGAVENNVLSGNSNYIWSTDGPARRNTVTGEHNSLFADGEIIENSITGNYNILASFTATFECEDPADPDNTIEITVPTSEIYAVPADCDLIGDPTAGNIENNVVNGSQNTLASGNDMIGNVVMGSGNYVAALDSSADLYATVVVGDLNSVEGSFNTALGGGIAMRGEASTAIGFATDVQHSYSTALGAGATTTADHQIMLGTAAETYAMPGITSGLSRSRQTGPLELVTSDAEGNLATDGGALYRTLETIHTDLDLIDSDLGSLNGEIDSINGEIASLNGEMDVVKEGVALSIAMENPDLTGNERLGVSMNFGTFDGHNAFGAAFMGVVSQNAFAGSSLPVRMSVSGSVGMGFKEETFGARVGVQFTQ